MSRFISDHEDTTTTDGKTITVKYTEPKYEIRKVVYVAQESINEIADAVAKRLPTVGPKRGKWVDGQCSNCGCDVPAYIIDWKWQKDMNANYCPNCGARMEESDDD